MATEQRIGFSFFRRATLKNVVRLIPALVIIAATLNTFSCGTPGLLDPVNGNGSNSPTATPTSGTGALAFVTNFNDGKVSSFTRNTTTGVLKRTGEVTAGKKKGPKGVVAAPSGSFLYVANNADGNIYEFSINANNGTLTPLSPAFVSNGSGTGPDELAINLDGTFLWVTGSAGTVTTYGINSSTGQLTQNSRVKGLNTPFGITVDTAGAVVYVADTAAGLVYSFGVGANGLLTQISSVFDLGSSGGTPAFITIDPAGTYIYVTDLDAGVIAILQDNAGVLAFGSVNPSTTTDNKPVGIGYAVVDTVGDFIFTANQATATLWSFLVPVPGFPSSPVQFGIGELNAPTLLVVDPQNAFVYTTNQDAGTVSQFSLSSTCFASGAPCFVGSVAVESSGSSSGPFGITLAQ